jgi:hypothetical protein
MQKCLIWVHNIILYDSEILGKHCHYSFRPDPLINMAATDNSCFWLADFLNLLLWNRLAKWTETS